MDALDTSAEQEDLISVVRVSGLLDIPCFQAKALANRLAISSPELYDKVAAGWTLDRLEDLATAAERSAG